jgi:hypothetical protein
VEMAEKQCKPDIEMHKVKEECWCKGSVMDGYERKFGFTFRRYVFCQI